MKLLCDAPPRTWKEIILLNSNDTKSLSHRCAVLWIFVGDKTRAYRNVNSFKPNLSKSNELGYSTLFT